MKKSEKKLKIYRKSSLNILFLCPVYDAATDIITWLLFESLNMLITEGSLLPNLSPRWFVSSTKRGPICEFILIRQICRNYGHYGRYVT